MNKEYEFVISNLIVEETIDIEASSEEEAYNKLWEMIDKAAKDLGITVNYNIDCITKEYEESFEYYLSEETLPDSMCLDSNTLVCTYFDGYNRAEIIVRGYVTVFYNNEKYRYFADMPKDLQEMFADGSAYDNDNVVIDENNWYEIFVNNDEYFDVAEAIEGFNASQLKEYCKDYLEACI